MLITPTHIYYKGLILIFLLPLLATSQLIIFGKKTVGTTINLELERENYNYIILYSVLGKDYKIMGRENIEYEISEKVTIMYEKGNPKNSIILSLSYIYISSYTLVSIVLFILWTAYYKSTEEKSSDILSKFNI